MDNVTVHILARDGDLSAMRAAIRRGDDVNSVRVSWESLFC